MCVSKLSDNNKCKMLNRSSIGRAINRVLTQARLENRLICGLIPAISYLENSPDDVVVCLLPETRPGDSTSHMQTVLLQAFCYENYIPVIKVDCGEKLAEMCCLSSIPSSDVNAKAPISECSCVIVTRNQTIPWNEDLDPPLTTNERVLADFYECTLEEYPSPIIQLPR